MSNSPNGRDLRIDFFRGLALIMIFIDHIPGNRLAQVTMKNFGFSDAAEVFVFLAGYSAVLAYGRTFDGAGFEQGAVRVGRRIFEIYYWHLAVLAASFVLLLGAFETFGNPAYLNNIGMWEFILTPGSAVAEALALKHQPNMLNILPLYIALLAWFPLLFLLLRRSTALGLGVSFAVWAAANAWMLNLPSTMEVTGWFLNPFAWQFLFALGAAGAMQVGVARWSPPRPVLWAALAFALFALIVAAPWAALPGLEKTRLISAELIGQMSKSYLSLWRVAHILALASIIGYVVSPQAAWLQSQAASAIGWLGRHSLEVFSLGTLLSFAGWIILNEAGAGLALQLAVSATGIGVMTSAAWFLEKRKRARKGTRKDAHEGAPSSAYSYSRSSSAGPA